jgi:hypothetical protein
MKAISLISNRVPGISPVNRIPCEARVITQILLPMLAITALTTRRSQPRNSNSIPHTKLFDTLANLDDSTNDLVTQNQGQLWIGKITIHNVQVCAAYTTGMNLN